MADRCSACGLKEAPYYDDEGRCPLCSPYFDGDSLPESRDSLQSSAVNKPNGNPPDDSTLEIRERAQELVAMYGGIRPAARERSKEMGEEVNPGIIGLALNGEDFPKARRVLGLPPRTVPVPPCPDCGHVHEQKATCTDKLEQARRKSDFYTLAFRFRSRADFERARRAVDADGDRTEWIMRQVEVNDERR